jgi:hypothetical protein
MVVTITKPTIGGSEDSWGLTINTALDDIVDGLNGVTTVAPNLTEGSWKVGGVAVGSTAAELNILDGVTASTAEINVLDGVTASTVEINYLDGVTSPIQTQINDLVAGESGGTVTSVGLSAPTGFSVSGSPVTSSGTLSLSFSSGYSLLTSAQATSISNIPTNTSQLTNDSGFITSQYTQPTSVGAVGTYAWLGRSTAGIFTAGSSYSGSGLTYSGILSTTVYNDDTAASIGTVSPSGTWRAMGTADRTTVRAASTLFLRIS